MIWTDEIKLDIIYPIYIYGSFLDLAGSRGKALRNRAAYNFFFLWGAQ
jgi:hypothetical protein